MEIKIKVLGIERMEDGRNRFVVLLDDKLTVPVILTDQEITTPASARIALISQLKSRNYINQEFNITV